jgi:hypothetical protein
MNIMKSDTKGQPGAHAAPARPRARCLRALGAAALGAGLFFGVTSTALAQQPPPPAAADSQRYVVLTNDGSRFEGELVERVAGSHVTIKLVTGDIRTIPAANVRAEWRPGLGPVGMPINGVPPGIASSLLLTQTPALTGVPLAYHGPDELTIHLSNATNETGTLYHESASGWEVVCQMPCTTTVDPKGNYKIHNSDVFRFPSGPGSVDLVADIGSRQKNRTLATWLIILGATVAPLGGILAAGIIDDHLQSGPTVADKAGGGAILGASIGMIVAGVVLLAVGPTSTLTTTSGQRIAQQPSIRLPGLGANVALTPTGFVF